MPEQNNSILDELIERYPGLSACRDDIWQAYVMIRESYQTGGKLLVAGNGGSAADAEHIVGELMKGFRKKRQLSPDMTEKIMNVNPEIGVKLCKSLQGALPAIALTGHVALSTACANDVDAAMGFAQQVLGYGNEGDVFLGITTSGDSVNIINALVTAQAKGLKTIVLTGRDGGRAATLTEHAVIVPETETYRIQELHLPVYHTLCFMLEDYFFES